MHKLLFGHVQILQTQCFYVIIRTYKSKTSVIQLYNLAKLRIQFHFLKLNSPFRTCFDKFPYYGFSPPLPFKMKKTPNLFKKCFENQKIPTIVFFFFGGGGGGGGGGHHEITLTTPMSKSFSDQHMTFQAKIKFSDTKVLAFNFFCQI